MVSRGARLCVSGTRRAEGLREEPPRAQGTAGVSSSEGEAGAPRGGGLHPRRGRGGSRRRPPRLRARPKPVCGFEEDLPFLFYFISLYIELF